MNKFFYFIKRRFSRHNFSILNKYNIGDICIWGAPVDCMYEPTVEITFWYKVFDKENDLEKILYECIDINTGKKYGDIDERELILYATFDEIE